jgi:hypothetical protein
VRRDGAVAHLLLHTLGKQLNQPHPTRHPTRAAIKTPRQFLQPVVEALLQFHQKPAFLESRLVVASTSLSDQTTASTVSRPSCWSAAIR